MSVPIHPYNLSNAQLGEWFEGTHAFEIAHDDEGPGKYEGNANPALARVLYERLDHSWYDDEDSPDEGGDMWFARVGRVIFCEDSQGFYTYTEHPTVADAQRCWKRGT